MDWADRTKGHGTTGKTASSFFYPSGLSEFGYLIQRENLIYNQNWRAELAERYFIR